jgi:excisionase family DNA binding protein
MTIAEVAEYLGVSKRTINNYFNTGLLSRIEITSKNVKIARSEVDRLLAEREQRQTPEDPVPDADTEADAPDTGIEN